MKDQLLPYLDNPNVRQYLGMVASAEGTVNSDNPYATMFGGGQADSLDDHPRKKFKFKQTDGKENLTSAAGAYQFIEPTWDEIKKNVGVTDFSPQSQDLGAIYLLKKNGTLDAVAKGDFQTALSKDGKIWASLPSSPYAQKTRSGKDIETMLGQASQHINPVSEGEQPPAPQQSAGSAAPAGGLDPATLDVNRLLEGLQKAKAAGDKEAVQEIVGFVQQKVGPAMEKAKAAGDKEAVAELTGILGSLGSAPAKPELPPLPQAEEKKAFDWNGNARTIYKEYNGKDFKGSPKEAEDWLKQHMANLNNNLVVGGYEASKMFGYSPEGKKAVLEAMKAYDDTSAWDVKGEIAQALLTDPTTYAGLGVGKLLTKGGSVAAKEAIKRGLRESLEKGTTERLKGSLVNAATGKAAQAAAGGAASAVTQDAVMQTARIGADGQEGWNYGETAGHAGLGAGIGAVLGKIGNKLSGDEAIEKFVKRSNGTEEGVRIKAEVAKDLRERMDNPNMVGQEFGASQINDVTGAEILKAKQAINGSKRTLAGEGVDVDHLNLSLDKWKSRSADEIEALRGMGDAGNAVADTITKAQIRAAQTAEQSAAGGVFKLGRAVNDLVPQPAATRFAIKALLGGQVSRKAMAQELTRGGNIKAADRILAELGSSQASNAQHVLDGLVRDSVARQAARGVTRRDRFAGMSDYDIVEQAIQKQKQAEYDSAIKEVDQGYAEAQRAKLKSEREAKAEADKIANAQAAEKSAMLKDNPDLVVPGVRNPLEMEAENSALKNDILARDKASKQQAADYKLVESAIQKQEAKKALKAQQEADSLMEAKLTPEEKAQKKAREALAVQKTKDPAYLIPDAVSTTEASAKRKAWEDALKDRYGAAVDPKADIKAERAAAAAEKTAELAQKAQERKAAREAAQAQKAQQREAKREAKKLLQQQEKEAAKNSPDAIQARADKALKAKTAMETLNLKKQTAELELKKAQQPAPTPQAVQAVAQAPALSAETKAARGSHYSAEDLAANGGKGSLGATHKRFSEGNLKFTPEQTIEALKAHAKDVPEHADAVDAILRNESHPDLYKVQDRIGKKFGEVAEVSSKEKSKYKAPVNPESYKRAMANINHATELAIEKAPNEEMKRLAVSVASEKDKTNKKLLMEKVLENTDDKAVIRFIMTYVEPLTKFGPKD